MLNQPNWRIYARHGMNDGKFNLPSSKDKGNGQEHPPLFPGYINHPLHPLTYQQTLTYEVNGVLSNKWSGTDGPDRFEESKKKSASDWRYLTKEVEYKVNSSGFRTTEFKNIDWQNSIVLFGCSCTFGIGLAEDETIAYKLEKLLGKPVINLAVPGGSNTVILNIMSLLREKFPIPAGVVVNWSTGDRFPYYFRFDTLNVGPWFSTEVVGEDLIRDDVNISKLWENRYLDRYNEQCESYYIAKNANAIWKDLTKYVTISQFTDSAHAMRVDEFFKIDLDARDLLHPGDSSTTKIAEYLYSKLK
jgi:hypothetical protein